MWALYQLCQGVSYNISEPDVQHSETENPMELLPSFQWHIGSFEDTCLPLLWARLKPFGKSHVLRLTQCKQV